jgi:hypothetical protein
LASIIVLLLGVVGVVGWWQLPALIEKVIEGRLADVGYPGSRLRVESVGLRQLKLSALSIPADSWRVQVREGAVDYRAAELLRPEVRAARFDGVRFELDLEPIPSVTTIAAASAPSWIDRSRPALAQLPVRAMFVTNGLIHFQRADQELDLPFDLRLTNDASMGQLRAQAGFGLEEGQWAGHRLNRAAIEAAVTVSVTPSVEPTPIGVLMDWIEQQQPGLGSWLRQTAFELRFSAGLVELANRSIVSNAVIRLDRPAPSGSSSEPLARFSAEAAAVDCAGVLLSEARGAGEITGDGLRMDGIGHLDESPFGFRLDVVLTNLLPVGPELAGAFELGTLRFHAYAPPPDWTGGQALQVSGELDASGRFHWAPEAGLGLWPELRFALEQMEWMGVGLTVEGARGAWSGAVAAVPDADGNLVRVDRIRYGEYEASELVLRIARLGDLEFEIELMNAMMLGGRARVPPVRWNWRTKDIDAALELEQISLRRLAELIPRFAGSVEGGLSGRVPVRWDGDGFAVGACILRLDRSQPARLRYPAKGLLTRGTAPGSERYRQLQLVEAALEDLRLTDLAIELYPADQRQTPVRLRLEGTFRSDQAVVPVKFNLNLNGDLDPIWRLLQLGEIDLEL